MCDGKILAGFRLFVASFIMAAVVMSWTNFVSCCLRWVSDYISSIYG